MIGRAGFVSVSFFCLALSAASLPAHAQAPDAAQALADRFARDGAPPPAPAVAPSAKKTAAAPPAARAPKPDAAYEAEMLAAAKAEADARRASDPAAMPATIAQPAPAAPGATPAPAKGTAVAETAAAPAKEVVAPPPQAAPAGPAHATVLLVLDPDATPSGSSGGAPAPVLCIGADCYVSAGTETPSKLMPRAGVTLTEGMAGDCEGHTHCIFRDVTLKPGGELQILDATLGKSGSSAPLPVQADASCAIKEGDLDCENTVSGLGYRAWIIPEALAQSAGALKLEGAIATDLIEEDINKPGDK